MGQQAQGAPVAGGAVAVKPPPGAFSSTGEPRETVQPNSLCRNSEGVAEDLGGCDQFEALTQHSIGLHLNEYTANDETLSIRLQRAECTSPLTGLYSMSSARIWELFWRWQSSM